MHQRLKRRWVNALRSGDYIQGGFNLKSAKKRFSCFGVLCDILLPRNWVQELSYSYDNFAKQSCLIHEFYFEECSYVAEVPVRLRQRFGISHSDKMKIWKLHQQQKSFEQIADFIEENF